MLLLVGKVALKQVKVGYNIENDLIALRDEFKYEIECFLVDGGKAIKKQLKKSFQRLKFKDVGLILKDEVNCEARENSLGYILEILFQKSLRVIVEKN